MSDKTKTNQNSNQRRVAVEKGDFKKKTGRVAVEKGDFGKKTG